MATLSGNLIIETSPAKISALSERGFGERREKYIVLAPVEALYLTERKKIKVGGLSFEKLLLLLKKKDADIFTKYAVYRDLRRKGYVARTGLKYGAWFRVYEKGIRVGEGHSVWLVSAIPEEKRTSIYDISRAIRLAHSVRKKMIWAVVDSEGDVTYYKMERVVP
jgi:tRNA-intron endonuclease